MISCAETNTIVKTENNKVYSFCNDSISRIKSLTTVEANSFYEKISAQLSEDLKVNLDAENSILINHK